ncbi:MAG: hypothetical protein JKY84_07745 [Emcibacteraceae bacterium]|nr:hypothetical protein [Emcibacteraceae bacterium]
MKTLFTIVMATLLTACNALQPDAMSSSDLPIAGDLIFTASVDETIEASKAVLKDKKWKILYDGEDKPTKNYSFFSNAAPFNNIDYDRVTWDMTLNSTIAPKHYIQAKTPTNLISFGAELFITIFESPKNGSIVSIAASSSQLAEKKKLGAYLEEFSNLMNEKID